MRPDKDRPFFSPKSRIALESADRMPFESLHYRKRLWCYEGKKEMNKEYFVLQYILFISEHAYI